MANTKTEIKVNPFDPTRKIIYIYYNDDKRDWGKRCDEEMDKISPVDKKGATIFLVPEGFKIRTLKKDIDRTKQD